MTSRRQVVHESPTTWIDLQKVILRNLIKPNQLIIRSYLQNFNFAWCVGIFVVRSVPGSGDFWEGSGTPRDGRRGKLKHGGIRIFSRISTTGNGVVKKVRACAPEAA